jgi:hypothetical protein
MTLSIIKITIMTLSIKGLNVILSISDTRHKGHSAYQPCAIMLSVAFFIIMLNVVLVSVVMPSVMAP